MQSRIADFARYGTEPIPGDGFALMYSWILALSLFFGAEKWQVQNCF
jgi:hypothetical protein